MTPNHPTSAMKKYELTDETLTLADGTVLHRIRAVREFPLADGTIITPGTLGGWVEKEENLSHFNTAWVSDSARVYGDAQVSGCTTLRGTVKINKTEDYVTAGPAGSRRAITTYCIGENLVFCGCFSGTLEQFAAAVETSHMDRPEYLAQYRAMIAYFSTLRQNKNS